MTEQKKPRGDVTRTARAGAYLERLTEAKGKRVVVDLAAPAREALDALIACGYETSQKAVISKALLAAAQDSVKKA